MLWMLGAAALGGILGGLSAKKRAEEEQRRLRQQQRMEQQAYGYRKAYNEGMYNLERTRSIENLGIASNRLAESFGMGVAGFNLGLEGQAAGNQAARILLADSAGMALAAQGASGVRGNDALQRQIDFHEGQFEKQLDLQTRGNSLSLEDMTQQYSNQFNDIGREIASWSAGGYRSQAKSLQDTYAVEMHGLEMQGYENAIDDAQWTWGDMFTGMLSGAASGTSFGGQVGEYFNQWNSKKDKK